MAIIKDSACYAIGELLAKSIPFLLLPYLTRRLGVAGFGDMSYYQSLMALLVIVMSLSQDGAVARYFYFYGQRSINLLVSTSYAYTFVVAIPFLLASWVIHSPILAILTGAAAFQSLFSTQLSLRQCQKLSLQYIILQILSALATGLLTIFFLEVFHADLVEKRFLALLIGNAVCVWIAYWLYRHKHHSRSIFSLRHYQSALSYLLAFGVPLFFHQISGYMKGQLDRIFIFHQFSNADLGIYSAAFQLAAVLNILIMAINKASVPYYYGALKSGKIHVPQVRKWARYALLLVPLPAMIAAIIPESWLTWFLGNGYADSKHYLVMFLFGIGLTIPYFILVNYLFYYGKNGIITICSLLSTALYCITLIFTIHIGLAYVPLAMIIGNIAILPILDYVVKQTQESTA